MACCVVFLYSEGRVKKKGVDEWSASLALLIGYFVAATLEDGLCSCREAHNQQASLSN